MPVTFTYSHERDVWCILRYGKESAHSSTPTRMYAQLTTAYGNNPTEADVSTFITNHITRNSIETSACIEAYQKDWDTIAHTFHERAMQVFGVTLPSPITAYLTINERCPYSIEDNLFFVSFPRASARPVAMHELWHFYTWYRFGVTGSETLDMRIYEDIKEALTVLLNATCADLFPEGVYDVGYSQHQTLRAHILNLWKTNNDIEYVWHELAHFIKG